MFRKYCRRILPDDEGQRGAEIDVGEDRYEDERSILRVRFVLGGSRNREHVVHNCPTRPHPARQTFEIQDRCDQWKAKNTRVVVVYWDATHSLYDKIRNSRSRLPTS